MDGEREELTGAVLLLLLSYREIFFVLVVVSKDPSPRASDTHAHKRLCIISEKKDTTLTSEALPSCEALKEKLVFHFSKHSRPGVVLVGIAIWSISRGTNTRRRRSRSKDGVE